MERAEAKEMVRRDFVSVAWAWRKWRSKLAAQGQPITEAIIKAAQVRPGMQVLDLASGAGDPALALAKAVGPRGHVTATDLVPEMLHVAEDEARAQGFNNMSFKQVDPETLPFEDSAFDAVTCRFGIMFFPDVQRVLGEVRRVLRPRGRAVMVAWGPPEQNPWFLNGAGIVMKYAHLPPPRPDQPHPFNFAAPDSVGTALQRAGFREVKGEMLTLSTSWMGSVEEGWEMIREISPSVRKALTFIQPERQDEMVKEILAANRRYHDGTRVNYPMVINMAWGVP